MIVQVRYQPGFGRALQANDFRKDQRLHTFDDVHNFVSQDDRLIEVTEETFGDIVWGNDNGEVAGQEAIFPYTNLDGNHHVHVFVDFSLAEPAQTTEYYDLIRTARWLDSRGQSHFFVGGDNAFAYLMTDEGKTIRKF